MRTIIANGQQTITNIAVEHYGNELAGVEILTLNAHINAVGIPLAAGTEVVIDGNSPLVNRNELERMKTMRNGVRVAAEVSNGENLVAKWHSVTANFLRRCEELEDIVLYKDMLAADRLVRDLHGEYNPEYETYDLYDATLPLYVMIGRGAEVKMLNVNVLVDPESWTGDDENISRYYLNCNSDNHMRVSYRFDLGSNLGYRDVCLVFSILEGGKGYFFGRYDGVGRNKGLGFLMESGDLKFTTTGEADGFVARASDWEEKPGVYVGNADADRVDLFHEGLHVAGSLNHDSYSPFPVNSVHAGNIMGLTDNLDYSKFGFFMMLRNIGGDADKVKFLTNAVNKFLYNRGIYKTFTAII